MAEALRHRGPDDDGAEAGEGWAFGMRRLAVQDVSRAGHQPMSRGDLTIVFNGEVYNFPALRKELAARGYEFESQTDTEVVLNAFREWGPASFSRFNGMFALAIVDRARRHVWLARDRFGKKPLFVARVGHRILFASELKAIIPFVRSDLALNRRALASYFRFLAVPGPLSIFDQVEKVPPASWMEVDLERRAMPVARSVYWTLPQPAASEIPTPERALEVVREAVRRRLIADVPVGALLSGGVDSSLVVACMTELVPDVRTFSIGFEDPRYDESQPARAVATHLGTTHTESELSVDETLGLLTRVPTTYDEPFADSSAIPTMAVAELARRDVTVALSGDGGDELFGGYHRYQIPAVVRLLRRAPAWVVGRLADSEVVRQRHARASAFAGASTVGRGYEELLATWRTAELRRLVPGVEPAHPVSSLVDGRRGSVVERLMQADARTYLIDDILQKVDRATMAVSLEARNPLLDPDVVAFAAEGIGLAREAPTEKRLLRSALRLRLPGHLVERPKRGFAVPVGEWLRGALRPLLEDLVMSRRDAEYDTSVARRVCERHLSGEITASPRVWSLLAFELWRSRWWS